MKNEIAHQDCLLEYTSSDHIMRHKRKMLTATRALVNELENPVRPLILESNVFFVATHVTLSLILRTQKGGKRTKACYAGRQIEELDQRT